MATAFSSAARGGFRHADAFERHPFITGIRNDFVQFHYQGWHQELVRDRITPEDVTWACDLLGRLSDRQWQDAFRAGGYDPDVAGRFIRALRGKLAMGRRAVQPPEWRTYEAY